MFSRKNLTIFLASIFGNFSFNLLTFGVVFFAQTRYHASPSEIGIANSCYSFSYLAGCLLLQRLIAAIPPKRCLMFGSLGLLCGALLILLAPEMLVCDAGYLVCGLATAFFWPPMIGWLAEGLDGKRLGLATAIFNACWSSGSIVSPYVGGLLCDHNPDWTIYIANAVFATGAVYFLVWNLQGKARSASSVSGSSHTYHPTWLRLPSWLGETSSYVLLGFLCGVYPLIATRELGFTPSGIGAFLTARILVQSIAMLLLGFFVFWQFNYLFMHLSHLADLVLLLSLAFLRNHYALLIAFICIGVSAASSYTASLFHGVTGSRNKTTASAIHEACIGVGQVVGYILGGVIYQHFGLRPAVFTLAAICAISPVTDILYRLFVPHKGKP
ncbi:MAG: MFS transporter [Victivallales bacterium]|nr:MFS transporter [Victivallales bacterium]